MHSPDHRIAQDDEADALLSHDPLALLIGMLLDQQIPMERAFAGPRTLLTRVVEAVPDAPRDRLDAEVLVALGAERLGELMAVSPAVHRFPGSMAKRVHALATVVAEEYGGDAEAVWRDAGTGAELRRRLQALPGFGAAKAQIFLALLGKQRGVRPEGWREAAGDYGADGTTTSVADVTGPETLQQVRAHKQAVKAAAKQRAGD